MLPAPRLEIDLEKIYQNASALVGRLSALGISVTGVTKAALGSPDIANTLLQAGVSGLGDSRMENLENLRTAGVTAPLALLRAPMSSQVARVVASADLSFNTEIQVIRQLSQAAQHLGCKHQVLLMVELGDLREGIMPGDVPDTVRELLGLPNLVFRGIGTNLACRSGVSPDSGNMGELSRLADTIEAECKVAVDIVSGGNSANLAWAFSGADTGRINNLRLGESILLGRETLHRQPLEGLHTDAFTLVAEVIESKLKPSLPTGIIAESAFGERSPLADRGPVRQTILAIGRQDIDPAGLQAPGGTTILGASSDHLILETPGGTPRPGEEMTFQLNYSALVRAMTSPFVSKILQPARAR